MKKVIIRKADPLFLEEVNSKAVPFDRKDYQTRLKLLVERMQERGISHVVIYGDREHFANIEYFSGFDCRFEEGLLIVSESGNVSILVGNEGISQTYQIPYEVRWYLYQNFSLQGQPRNQYQKLTEILEKAGIEKGSRIGVVGYKYFYDEYIHTDPAHTFDIPAYILGELQELCGYENVVNFTQEITGFPNGIRMTLKSAKELAWAENAGNRSAAVVQRMLKILKPGLSEEDVARGGQAGFTPISMFPLVNFGAEKVRIGVASPTDRVLQLGEVCGLCYAIRGCLTSKTGIASYDAASVREELKPHLEFFRVYWKAISQWLETARVNASCAELYDSVMGLIGGEEYGVTLNTTHYTGTDEWVNSPMFKNSPYFIMDGSHIQVDVIANKANPVITAICEDSVVVAGPKLRQELREQYPDVYARIIKRQQVVREVLGIQIHDDLMPMSNLSFVYYPYMLNTGEVFALECDVE